MSVKRSQSGSRILTVLETIAHHQPIGVSALARLLGEDKSATQRALVTLAHDGWIRGTGERHARWELTARILAVAQAAHGGQDLRRRARPILEQLRNSTGETAFLAVLESNHLAITDVVESAQVLRMVPAVGTTIIARNTATGRAMLAFMDAARQAELLGEQPDPALRTRLASTARRGYAVSAGEINKAATNIAAPVFGLDGEPTGAIVVCGPRERLQSSMHEAIGNSVAQAARELSFGRHLLPPTTTDPRRK